MTCESCGSHKAQVSFQVLFSGKKVMRSYCLRCAEMIRRGDALSVQMAIANALPEEAVNQAKACPLCGTTVEMLQKTGRMGCAACYRAFSPVTEDIFKKMSGTQRHTQEVKEESLTDESHKRIDLMRSELAQAVSTENYERAAELRDAINALVQKEGEKQA
ncbi:MAG: UvrB/UvrC motif-containing protein [Clostridia bacterium]|nr:UvrB/UvrC motif-containing protein [Clostridia bacterium]